MTIVLVMHGMTPKDFPKNEKKELMRLHAQYEGRGDPKDPLKKKHDELERKMRTWPRSAQNDPFWEASYEIASELKKKSGREVIVGFNEFCAPSVDEALDQAVASGAEEIVVITPMVTRGGIHSEIEIPGMVESAKKRHPKVSFSYTWPFPASATAAFLADQIERLTPKI